MSLQGIGYDPVAQFEEINGDIYDHLSQVTENIGDEYAIISVVHGGIYLTRLVDHWDAHWKVIGEVKEGEAGSWDDETDKVAAQVDEETLFVDDLSDSGRYLVYAEN